MGTFRMAQSLLSMANSISFFNDHSPLANKMKGPEVNTDNNPGMEMIFARTALLEKCKPIFLNTFEYKM